jgi:hypothetical protein
MIAEAITLEKRVKELNELAQSNSYNQLFDTISEIELEINSLALGYIKTSDSKYLSEISRKMLGIIKNQGYFTVDNLTVTLEYLFAQYDYIHSKEGLGGIEKKRKVRSKNSAGEMVDVYQVVHPIMVSLLPSIIETFFGQQYENNADYSRVLSSLFHDVPEDKQAKGYTIEQSVEEVVSFLSPIFWEGKEGKAKNGSKLTKQSICLSHEKGTLYEKYCQLLFVEEKDDTYILYPDDIFIEDVVDKASDTIHNGVNQGVVITPDNQEKIVSEHLGLSPQIRMIGTLKSITFLETAVSFFNTVLDNGQIPSQYQAMFDLIFIQHSVIQYNLKQLWDGIYDYYSKNEETKGLLDALVTAMEGYKQTENIKKITEMKHDINYYLEMYRLTNTIPKDIYDGTVQIIRNRANKLDKEPLYADISQQYHLVKLCAHILGMQAVLEQTYSDENIKAGMLGKVTNLGGLP